MTRTIAFIPARGGSKRIPKKNLAFLAGRPLLKHTLLYASELKKLGIVDEVFVSSDDDGIKAVAKDFDVKIVDRPEALATDTTTDYEVIRDFLGENKCDLLMILRPTNPLRRVATAQEAIKMMLTEYCTSVRTMKVVKEHPEWMYLLSGDFAGHYLNFNTPREKIRSNEIQQKLIVTGTVDVVKSSHILSSDNLYGDKIRALIVDELEATDIDTYDDLFIAESKYNLLRRGV